MDKNSIVGLLLIFGLFFFWAKINAPSEAELAEQQRIQDSIKQAQHIADSLELLPETTAAIETSIEETSPTVVPDSVRNIQLAATYGTFAPSAVGEDKEQIIENELFKVAFNTKGGNIKWVELKHYDVIELDSSHNEYKAPVRLLEDKKNKFEYFIPMANLPRGGVSTADLYFTPSMNGNTITMRASAGQGKYFEQKYTINEDSYGIDYQISLVGLDKSIKADDQSIQLNWVNYLDHLELNAQYERNYSSIYFKPSEDSPDHCSCTSDEIEVADEEPLKWISHSNQFFNSALITKNAPFKSAVMETKMLEEDDKDLKILKSQIKIPLAGTPNETFAMTLYSGPNEFKRLKAYGSNFHEVIPYGWSIFGTVNRWIIRPLFDFLSRFIGSAGLIILMLTVIVKLVLYPLTYKMLYSQSKMAVLKPRISSLKEKFGDDQQKQQMETMKLYREFGVSPLGGCFPIALQMPIWFALYRFFPGSIDFRQASFLWASDLSSFDVFAWLPFEIPFYGAHVSMFTLLWAATTVIYTFYNTKHMDMSVNPMMKYMQYGMPVMFLFFFNNFASGLTCYLLFSNMFNIGQTIITKDFIINKDKIKKELEDYKKKPKKKGGFQSRLEAALKEQQKVQQQKGGNSKKKK